MSPGKTLPRPCRALNVLSDTLPRSRAEAIERGDLVDVTELAAGKRFIVPVALTAEVFEDVRDLSSHYVLSSETVESRLDRVLHYARANVASNESRSGFEFSLYLPVGDRTTYSAALRLMSGDEPGQSVITISKLEQNRRLP